MTNRSASQLAALMGLVLVSLSACSGAPADAGPSPTNPRTAAAPASSKVPVLRGTRAEHAQKMVDCLRRAGFNATVSPDPLESEYGMDGITSKEMAQKVSAANEACRQQVGDFEDDMDTDTEIVAKFEHWKKAAACLQRQGQPVPPIPSREEFIRAIKTAAENQWHPYNALPGELPDGRLARPALERLCPSEPWMMTELGLTMH